MLSVTANEKSFLRAKEQLKLLGLDRKARWRILKTIGKVLTKQTKGNIRNQRDPEGKSWKRRKNGKRKVLRGFTQKMKTRVKNQNRMVQVGWPTARGKVAMAHHTGQTEQSGLGARRKQAKKKKEPKPTDPSSRELAKELRELGYRLPPQGRQKRGRKPTVKFITQNMTVGEVNMKISELENKTPARNWGIERPERRLIGMSPKRVAMVIKREMNRNRSK